MPTVEDYNVTLISEWDIQGRKYKYSNLNEGKNLNNLRHKSRNLMDIDSDNSFKAHSQYFKRQQPPNDTVSQWTDSVFPPNQDSLMKIHKNDDVTEAELNDLRKLKWERAKTLFKTERFVLYNTVTMDDVEQGGLGNCYFLSVLSELANRPEIYDNIFIDKDKTKNNCYRVKLMIRGIPKIVCVDDYFPATMTNTFAFALSGPRELWVQVLEKAWAKINGSYASTIAGIPSESFACLSEAPCVSYIHKKYNVDDLWSILKKAKTMGYYLATNTKSNPEAEKMGLVQGHAYSLTNLHEFKLPDGKILKLIQLRNPWGNFEWKGPFSDNSDSWNILPDLRKKVGLINKDDGIFFMDFDAFLHYYPYTFISKYHKNANYKFQKIEQQSSDHVSCAKIVIKDKGFMKIGMHVKQLRFYDKVPQYKLQVARIIIANFNPITKKYTYSGSDFHNNEQVYSETTHLEPGEYHIFTNLYWPYLTPIHYTISTYTSNLIEIMQLNKENILDDYLEQILIDYLDNKIPKEVLSNDTSIQFDNKDNDLGFYMVLITNNSSQQFKFSADCAYSYCIFLNHDMVVGQKKIGNTFEDKIETLIYPNKRQLFVWRLIANPWDAQLQIKNKKLYAYSTVNETPKDVDTLEKIRIAFPEMKKEKFNEDLLYSEIDYDNSIILILKNSSRDFYAFSLTFDVMTNLNIAGNVYTKTINFTLITDKCYSIRLDKLQPDEPFSFEFTYSYKKIQSQRA